jgi:hypothetical protein
VANANVVAGLLDWRVGLDLAYSIFSAAATEPIRGPDASPNFDLIRASGPNLNTTRSGFDVHARGTGHGKRLLERALRRGDRLRTQQKNATSNKEQKSNSLSHDVSPYFQ